MELLINKLKRGEIKIKNKKYSVYIHINKVNNKTYIGFTSKKPHIRWGGNGIGYITQPFYKAIEKYGWDNFEHIILFENKTKEEAEFLEILFIKTLLSNNEKYGYNIGLGEYMEKRENHPNAKKVICDGKIFGCIEDCAEYYNIKSVTMRSWLCSHNTMPLEFFNKGLNYLDDAKEITPRISTHNSKSVICNNITFNSIKECADCYSVNAFSMRDWLRKRCQMPKKFKEMKLRFADEAKALKKGNNRNAKARKVICNDEIFESIKVCAEFYNINKSTMADWLRGRSPMPEKFIDLGLNYVDNKNNKINTNSKLRKKVICNDIIYDSMKSCADYYNINYQTMCGWITGRNKMPQQYADLGLRYYNLEVDGDIKQYKRYKGGHK